MIFKGISVAKNCLRPDIAPLNYCFWNQFCVQFLFPNKLKNKILFSHSCLFQSDFIDLLTPKFSHFKKYNKKYIKYFFSGNNELRVLKPQFHISQNILLICFSIFLKLWLAVCILNMFHSDVAFIIDISSFQNEPNHTCRLTRYGFKSKIVESS